MEITILPTVNALLNSLSACFIVIGYYFIRQNKREAHKRAMLGACVTSTLFLISYLVYHYAVGSKSFEGVGWIRPLYFSILISHTILAALIVPLVFITLTFAFRSQFEKHKKIARWTYWIWLYVSITGVVIYGMLYHLT